MRDEAGWIIPQYRYTDTRKRKGGGKTILICAQMSETHFLTSPNKTKTPFFYKVSFSYYVIHHVNPTQKNNPSSLFAPRSSGLNKNNLVSFFLYSIMANNKTEKQIENLVNEYTVVEDKRAVKIHVQRDLSEYRNVV